MSDHDGHDETPRWDLSSLYDSFDEHFLHDLQACEQFVDELEQWVLNSSRDDAIAEYVTRERQFRTLSSRVVRFATLSSFAHTDDNQAAAFSSRASALVARFDSASSPFLRWLATNGPFSDPHLSNLARQGSQRLTVEQERLVARFRRHGACAFARLHEQLLSRAQVTIGDQKKSWTALNAALSSTDPISRHNSCLALTELGAELAPVAASCLNAITADWRTIAELRNHESALELSLLGARLTQPIFDNLHVAIRRTLPIFHRYFRHKAQLLGIDGPLPFHSLTAPLASLDEPDQHLEYSRAIETISSCFARFDEKMGALAQRAATEKWIDGEPRLAKSTGAFCHPIRAIGESRILLSFTSTDSSLSTLAHELGHAFHNDCLANEDILLQPYSIATAETASVFAELLLLEEMIETAPPANRLDHLAHRLAMAARIIVGSYCHLRFEEQLHEHCSRGLVSAEQLTKLMHSSLVETYGDSVSQLQLGRYGWVFRRHLYGTSRCFYNYPYAFGLLLALLLHHRRAEQGPVFAERYRHFLAASGRLDTGELAALVDVDLTKPDCWQAAIATLEHWVAEFVNIT